MAMSRNTLFLFATEVEAAPFRRRCPDAEIVISGVGMVETAATITRLWREGVIREDVTVVLGGIAGCYAASLPLGEVVEVVSECCVSLPERFRVRYERPSPRTSLRKVASNTIHRSVADAVGAEVENMEGAALFALAQSLGFEAVEIRAISNRVGESFEKWNIEGATTRLAEELIGLTL